MSSEPTFKCHNCGAKIELSESLAAPFVEAARAKLEAAALAREQHVAKQEAKVRAELAQIARDRSSIDEQVAAKLKADRASIAKEEAEKARTSVADELARHASEAHELHQLLEQRSAKLFEAQKAEVELRQKQRELDEKLREADLAVEKRVDARLSETRDKARAEVEAANRLRVAEKEKTISDLQQQLATALRKAEKSSEQHAGEVQELDLESTLRGAFSRDSIHPVPKGQTGGDALQRVFDGAAQPCGTILWESKRTRLWSDGWLSKLRSDQRAAKAEVAVLVTQALPAGVTTFQEINDIWVTTPTLAIALAGVLRAGLIETAAARRAAKGQEGKMELLYAYLSGPQFKQRVQGLLEGFSALKRDLESEKAAMQRIWAKRDKQLEVVMLATTGMYGDMQGIVGRSLPEIEGMGLEALGPGTDAPEITSG